MNVVYDESHRSEDSYRLRARCFRIDCFACNSQFIDLKENQTLQFAQTMKYYNENYRKMI